MTLLSNYLLMNPLIPDESQLSFHEQLMRAGMTTELIGVCNGNYKSGAQIDAEKNLKKIGNDKLKDIISNQKTK